MKLVGLISGGKDSFFNLMHCIANSHEVIALANLHPAEADEIDSWMFQTVGHDIVSLYGEAMDVPLYRHVIHGTNISQGLSYVPEYGDETEDLYDLLVRVKQAHPGLEAVSVGAIASNYQRLRVENVAGRLGLTVLAYLWERDQIELLAEMIAAGLIAILVKVAAIGLQSRHLGRTLSEMQPILHQLHEKFDVHPCGEGGEYETIVLDCPIFRKRLFKEVINLESDTAYLRLMAELHDKPAPSTTWKVLIRQAAGLEQSSLMLLSTLAATHMPGADSKFAKLCQPEIDEEIRNDTAEDNFFISRRIVVRDSESMLLKETLPGTNADILFCFVLLRDMSIFPTINKHYGGLFTVGHPPSRVCVASQLSSGIACIINTVSLKRCDPLERKLWIQGRSYWAPSNIGPYSQSTIADGLSFISGQIGLLPATMTMAPTFAEQCVWSLQSLTRILRTQQITGWSGIAIAYVLGPEWVPAARISFAHTWEGRSDVELLIVEMRNGSKLPREAVVEWQFVAYDKTGPYLIKLDSDTESGLEVYFGPTPQTSLHWAIPAACIHRLEGKTSQSVKMTIARKPLVEANSP